MNIKNNYALGNIYSLLQIYFAGIACHTIFRLILLMLNLKQLGSIPSGGETITLVLRALWMGVRFDTVIACYILLIPAILAAPFAWFRRLTLTALDVVYLYIQIMYIATFLVATIDIPFFNQFFARLNNSIFLWTDNLGVGLRMILREPRYIGYLPLFIAVSGAYIYIMRRIRQHHGRHILWHGHHRPTLGQFARIVAGSLLLWLAIFAGIRGRIARKSPIRVGTAYFSNYPFINQLGLNPTYTLMRSILDARKTANQPIRHIPDEDALKHSARSLKADSALSHISPIARRQQGYPQFEGRNLILIIMESLSMHKLNHPAALAPYLSRLRQQAWSFDSAYSAGIHTFNGIYSTLYAHPAIMSRHSMYNYFASRMAGLPNLLAEQGYQTIFFIPHDDQFDNIAGFLASNDMHHIIAQKDYPANAVKSSMGVSDGYMFRDAIPRITQLADRGKPFFATFMTASDHAPYVLPHDEGFQPRTSELPTQMTEYADWALERFMTDAATQAWYTNTLFVFVADHGSPSDDMKYDINFGYHHIPLIIYAPGLTTPQRFTQKALQIDVFPTVAANLGFSFINNTFGIDLLHETREAIVFSTDDKLACMNDSLLYIYRTSSPDGLYRYRTGQTVDCSEQHPAIKEKLRLEAFSWLQTSQWMIANGKAAVPSP